jgi:diaminopimelate epimerase
MPVGLETAALRGAPAGGRLRRCRSSTMSPHRLRRGAWHLPARRSRQNANLFSRAPQEQPETMEFAKLHALGNDFLIMKVDEAGSLGVSLASLAKKACDRHQGVGGDGVVFYRPTLGDRDADVSALIFNADGGKAEMSGNGVRCLATHLVHSGKFALQCIRIRTVAGIRSCRLKGQDGRIYRFESSMGPPVTEPALVPARLVSASGPLIDCPLDVGDATIPVTVVSIGNPHCSTFWADVDQAPVESLGPRIEHHGAFPKRTNVEFIQILSRRRLRVRFWERGVGRTSASGTGSCAAAVAGILRGLVESPVEVETEGGVLTVAWSPPGEVLLTGTAEHVCHGSLADDLVCPEPR